MHRVHPAPRIPGTPATRFALYFGLVYLVVAVWGFVVTGFSDFTAMDGPRILGLFMVNPLHNVIHLAIAVVSIAAARSFRAARVTNTAIGLVLGLVTVLGLAHTLMFLGIHSLGDPDNFLHLASATLALYFGTIGAEPLAVAGRTTADPPVFQS